MIVDLFAGPGGWDEGLRLLGVDQVIGVEKDPAACATARAAGHARLAVTEKHTADVTQVDPAQFAGADGVIASPPCGPFSKAGRRGGISDLERIIAHVDRVRHAHAWVPYDPDGWADDRSPLILEPVRWVSALWPRWVAFEQVPDALPVWHVIGGWLAEQGYSVAVGELSAERYGVAQTRRRAILKGRRDGQTAELPPATHARYVPGRRKAPQADALFDEPDRQRIVLPTDRGLLPWVSMADALGYGMTERPYPVLASGRTTGGPDREKVGGSTARALIYAERDAGRWTLSERQANGAERTGDEPAPTLMDNGNYRWTRGPAGDDRADSGQYGDRADTDAVRISVQQAGILQSFPADYPWQGNKTAQFRQVGDAVPPLLAAAILADLVRDTPCP